MKKVILFLAMLVSINGFSAEKHFYAYSGWRCFSEASAWGGTLPSAGDNLHIHGPCHIDVSTGIDYGYLFLDDCERAGMIYFGNPNFTISVNGLIANTSCASVNLTNGGILRIRSGIKITNPGIISDGPGFIEFYENAIMPANISSYTNLSIYTVTGSVNLTVPITVRKRLLQRSGLGSLVLGVHDLKIDSNGTIESLTGNAFIKAGEAGRLIQYVNSNDVLFPIKLGGPYSREINPLKINNSGTPDWFSVGLKSSFLNTPVPNNCLLREWYITEETPGGSNAALTFFWDNSTELNSFNKNSKIAIAGFNGSQWIEKNSSDITGNTEPYFTSAGGFTSFGYMAVKNKSSINCNIKLIPEGFLNEVSNHLNKKDTVFAYLRNVASPFNIMDSAKGILDSLSFTVRDSFYNAPTGNYFIVIKHRNSLETWSKTNGESLVVDSTHSYDFTSSSSQAYGNNLKLKGARYCTYSGDINHDGAIDLTDLVFISNSSANFETGYSDSDINGDNIVDLSDMTIAFNNTVNFISLIRP